MVIFLSAVAFLLLAYVGMRDYGFSRVKEAARRLRRALFEHHTTIEQDHVEAIHVRLQ